MLAPETVEIDARSEVEMLQYMYRVAEQLWFHAQVSDDAVGKGKNKDKDDESRPRWSEFLDRDPLFLMAEITNRLENSSYYQNRGSGSETIAQALDEDHALLSNWIARAKRDPNLRDALERIVTIQKGKIEEIARDLDGPLGETVLPNLRNALELVQVGRLGEIPRLFGMEIGAGTGASPPLMVSLSSTDVPASTVQRICATLLSPLDREITLLGEEITRTLHDQLAERRNHSPHIGLMLAFLRMRDATRQHINRIPDAHLTFFYRDVLGLAPREAKPDHAAISFELAPDVAPFTLPQGAKIAAGLLEDGTSVIYETTEPLHLDRSEVAAVKTLRLEHDPATGALVDMRTAEWTAPLAQPIAPFGTRGTGPPAEAGLVVVSPLLLLDAGRRTIRFEFDLASPSPKEPLLLTLLKERKDVPAGRYGLKAELLGENGSFVPGTALIAAKKLKTDGITLTLTLELAETDPPLIAVPEPVDGMSGGQLDLSLVRHPYGHGASLFHGLEVRKVTIAANIEHYPLTTITTPEGPVGADAPFAPLGAQPDVGARMTFTLPGKPARDVTLTLPWQPLPPGGLTRHYRAYHVEQGDFEVALLQKDGPNWATVRTKVPLFGDTRDEDAPRAEFAFSNEVAAATFRLQLTAPTVGFGRLVYPALVAEAAAKAARKFRLLEAGKAWAGTAKDKIVSLAGDPPKPPPPGDSKIVPPPPYTPRAAAPTISFNISGEVGGAASHENGVLIAKRPFGRVPARQRGSLRLFDAFTDQGRDLPAAMFIGLRNVAMDGRINLFLDLEDDAQRLVTASAIHGPHRLAWYYMSHSGWTRLGSEAILSDATNGLERAGRIILALPGDMSTADPEMPGGLVWIAVTPLPAHGDALRTAAATIGRVRHLSTSAATAVRITDAPWTNAPARSLSRIADATVNTRVRTVTQLVAAQAGRAAEDTRSFRVRASERLRHKSRAIQRRDFEELVLDAFPEISDAKVVRLRPGQLVVAVAGHRRPHTPLPRVAPHVLRNISKYLAERAQPGVSISAASVRFEPVRLRLWVDYDSSTEGAFLVELARRIDRWIAPWIDNPAQPCPIGTGRLDPIELHTVLEAIPGVRSLRGLTISRISATGGAEEGDSHDTYYDMTHAAISTGQSDAVWPRSALSVLVPSRDHLLHALEGQRADGEMRVAQTFTLNDKSANALDDPDASVHAGGVAAMRIGAQLIPAASPIFNRPSLLDRTKE